LSHSEAASRLARAGPNRLRAAAEESPWRQFLAQFVDPLGYLLIAAATVSVIAWVLEGGEGTPFDTIVIMAIVIANALPGFAQQQKAEQAVAALRRIRRRSAVP
jgi:Ca2+-transporting ATPase